MAAGVASLTVRGNVTEALAALEALGIKAEETGVKAESALGGKLVGAAERTGGAFGKLGGIVGGLGLPFSESFSKMGEKMGEVETKGAGFASSMAGVGKTLTLGVAAAAVGVGYEAVEMADKLETSRAKLEASLKAAGSSFDKLKPQIGGVDSSMEKLGFTNAQSEAGLAALTIATQNPTKAMELMGVTADLARYKNVDLATAGTAVAKAMEGQLKPLKQLGIDLPVVSSSAEKVKVAQDNMQKSIDASNAIVLKYGTGVMEAGNKHNPEYEKSIVKVNQAQAKLTDAQTAGADILAELTKRVGGQATEYTQTFAGKMQVLRATTEDLAAKLGMVLIPIIEKVAQVVSGVIVWFEKHKQVAEAVGLALAALVAGPMAAFVVELGVAAAEMIIAAAPILAITALVAGLAYGIDYLATHWSQVWRDIKQWTDDAINFLRSGFGTLIVLMTGPLIAPLILLALHWQQVWGFIQQVTNDIVTFVRNMVNGIADGINRVVNFFENLPGNIWNALGNLAGDFWNFGVNLMKRLIDGIGSMAGSIGSSIGHAIESGVNSIPGVGSVAKMFGFAEGGVVPGAVGAPMLAVVHGGEYVIPPDVLQSAASPPGGGFTTSYSSGGGGGGGDLVIQVNGSEFARVAGPDLRNWLLQTTKKNATRVGLA